MSQLTKIAHLTSVHKDGDVRIFHKECVSLAENGFSVFIVIPNTHSRLENGVLIVSFPSRLRFRFMRVIRTVNEVYRKAIALDADVYHLHDPELLRIALKLKKRGKKVIYDAHEDLPRQILDKHYIPKIFRRISAFFLEKYENKRVAKLDGVITATPFIRDRFKKINPNTIDINNFPLQREIEFIDLSGQLKEKSICYIGGITEIRGLREAIIAAGKARVKLYIAGVMTDLLLQKYKSMPEWEYVEYLGHISREKAMELKSKCMAGVVPFLWAQNHINAQPNKIFEYMASSLPVVCSDFDLWKQIVEDNKCGICANSANPDSLAEAFARIMNDPETSSEMGKTGKRLVQEVYNWDIEKVKLINFYDKIISN